MTFLMHAVNSQSDKMMAVPTSAETNFPRQREGEPEGAASEVPTPSAQNTPAPSQRARPEQEGDLTSPQPDVEQQQQQTDEEEESLARTTTNRRRSGNGEQLDPWVPVVSSVLEFAKKALWMADVSFFVTIKAAYVRLFPDPCFLFLYSKILSATKIK